MTLPESEVQSRLQFKQYAYRIVITALFSAVSIISGMCWVVVTPISVPIQNAFEVSASWVAFIPMSYLVFFVFINFPSNWVLDVKGIKKGVVIGASITFLGCLIRLLVRIGFAFVIIGQSFCAIAQPFILNAPMKIATRWFKPQNRSLALAILSVVNIIGTAVGFVIPPLFVSQNDKPDKTKDNFFILLLVQAIIAGVAALLTMIFFKESPPTPASISSMTEPIEFKQSICIMFRDKRFISLVIAFGIVNGTFNIYGSLMDDILDPYGFSSDQVSQFGAALMVAGIVSAALLGAYVQKTLKYRNTFILCGILGILTTAAFPLSLKFLSDAGKYYWLYMGLVICQGIVFIPLMPLSIDYGTDTMFPIGEAQITGLLFSTGQIFGIIFIETSQLIFGLGNSNLSDQDKQTASFNSVLFCNSFLAFGCIVQMLQNRQLKRSKLQKSKSENQSLLGSESSIVISQN